MKTIFDIPDKTIKKFLLGLFLIEIVMIAIVASYLLYSTDEFEHIHASWLVWSGKVPYRDFFEHHNPLLWYLFAPISALFYENANVLYVGHCIAVTSSLITLIYLYKIIIRYIGNPLIAFVALILFTTVNKDGRFSMVEFRPDIFAQTCFVAGIYYYMRYLEKKKLKNLSIAFILFAVSFLLIQKMALILVFLGFYSLYLAAAKVIKFTDMLKAAVVPGGILAIFFFLLWYADILKDWFTLNVELNALMMKFYGFHFVASDFINFEMTNYYNAVSFDAYPVIICIISLILSFRFIGTSDNKYRNLFFFLFCSELFIRFFTFSPHFYYFSLLNMLGSIIVAAIIVSYKNKFTNTVIGLMCLYGVLNNPYKMLNTSKNDLMKENVDIAQFLIDNTDKDDTLTGGNIMSYNLYRNNADYNWFGLSDVNYIYNAYFTKDKYYDFNKLIAEKRPKIIYNEDIVNASYEIHRKKLLKDYNYDMLRLFALHPDKRYFVNDLLAGIKTVYAYKLDQELIEKYYKPTGFYKFWILKDENDL